MRPAGNDVAHWSRIERLGRIPNKNEVTSVFFAGHGCSANQFECVARNCIVYNNTCKASCAACWDGSSNPGVCGKGSAWSVPRMTMEERRRVGMTPLAGSRLVIHQYCRQLCLSD